MRRLSIRKLLLVTLFVAIGILIITRYKLETNLEQINLTLKQLDTATTQLETLVFPEKKQNFPVWKTIKLDSYQDANKIRKTLGSNGFQIEYWANDILDKTPLNQKGVKLNLALVSAGQLGFNEWVPYEDILKRAQALGLKPLPAEVGHQLRLQYPDQPENEWLHIAMEPIPDSAGDPTIFDILHFDNHTHGNQSVHGGHGHSLQLCSSSVRSDVLWSPSSLWVFATN